MTKIHTEETAVPSDVYREQILWNKLKRMWRGIFHHGLFLYTSRNLLFKLGINIDPYWIEKEGKDLCKESFSIADYHKYQLAFLSLSEMSMLASQMKWLAYTLEKFEEGNYRALGLYDENRLAAFTMVEYGSFKNYGKQFKMEANEAYLTNMYTFEDYRGQNLAPYLRYQCYKQLQQEGKNQFYSITQYFNKSSLKFKAKLGAQHHELWLHLGLFNKFRRTFLLKRYE